MFSTRWSSLKLMGIKRKGQFYYEPNLGKFENNHRKELPTPMIPPSAWKAWSGNQWREFSKSVHRSPEGCIFHCSGGHLHLIPSSLYSSQHIYLLMMNWVLHYGNAYELLDYTTLCKLERQSTLQFCQGSKLIISACTNMKNQNQLKFLFTERDDTHNL